MAGGSGIIRAAAQDSTSPCGGGEPSPPEPTVAVVDDDEPVRNSLQAMLEAEGFAVETFAAAHEFLQGHRHAPNTCLLIDVRMPAWTVWSC